MIVKAAHRRPEGPFWRLKSDFYRLIHAPIFRRLRRHPLPGEGGFCSSLCTTCDTEVNPVTLASYSSPRSSDTFPSEPGPLRGPSVISSGVEKSPRTMVSVVSGKYVSRRNVSLKSDRLTASAISPFGTSYHLPLRKRWDNKTPCHFERSREISPHYGLCRKWEIRFPSQCQSEV